MVRDITRDKKKEKRSEITIWRKQMTSWMKQLTQHYEKTRDKYPDDDLMIVFDIDNTIIDMREMIAYALERYDVTHGTDHFNDLTPESLTINENQVDDYLAEMGLDADTRRSVSAWYLEEYRSWGINRFSLAWSVRDLGAVIAKLDEWGFDTNIYNVPDLESFLKAVLLHPTSVTSDFNFPKWHYFGRGPGENASHHTYELRDLVEPATFVAG